MERQEHATSITDLSLIRRSITRFESQLLRATELQYKSKLLLVQETSF